MRISGRAPIFTSLGRWFARARTGLSARRRASMRAICLSDPRCRSTSEGDPRPSRHRGSRASAAPRTWAAMHGAAGTRVHPGSKPDSKPIPKALHCCGRGRKLVVQIGRHSVTRMLRPLWKSSTPSILPKSWVLELAPVMVYADDTTHIVTRKGSPISCFAEPGMNANRLSEAWRAIPRSGAGAMPGLVERLRKRRVILRPEDLGIDPLDAEGVCWPHARSRI